MKQISAQLMMALAFGAIPGFAAGSLTVEGKKIIDRRLYASKPHARTDSLFRLNNKLSDESAYTC